MQTNSNLIPKHLTRNRDYGRELEVRHQHELEDDEQTQCQARVDQDESDFGSLQFRAKSIMC